MSGVAFSIQALSNLNMQEVKGATELSQHSHPSIQGPALPSLYLRSNEPLALTWWLLPLPPTPHSTLVQSMLCGLVLSPLLTKAPQFPRTLTSTSR